MAKHKTPSITDIPIGGLFLFTGCEYVHRKASPTGYTTAGWYLDFAPSEYTVVKHPEELWYRFRGKLWS